MSPAESIFDRKISEVHSGADSVKFYFVWITKPIIIGGANKNKFSRIRVIYVTDFKRGLVEVLTRVEPRINFVSNWDGVFLCACSISRIYY